MVSALRRAWKDGQLAKLQADQVKTQLDALMQQAWVVYSKPTIQKPDTVVEYLSRYTHRVAISDQRIETITHTQVRFGYKDYRDGERKSLQLPAEEFIRRFLLHVLPPGFMRIRHYGFLSNRCRAVKLAVIRALLSRPANAEEPGQATPSHVSQDLKPMDCLCPKCRQGRLRVYFEIAPKRRWRCDAVN